MLSLTRKTDYALVAMAQMAEHGSDAAAPISARHIADQFGLPQHVLVKVLKDLHRAGLVGSTRGARGGYYLHRDAAEISIADVVEALEGPFALASCCDDDAQDDCAACRTTPACPISHNVRALNDRVSELLQSVTLRELMKSPAESAFGRLQLVTVGGDLTESTP